MPGEYRQNPVAEHPALSEFIGSASPAENKQMSPGDITRAVGRSVQRVSTVLAALRLGEVVRYESDGKRNRYRLKHPGEVRSLLSALSRFVKAASAVGR